MTHALEGPNRIAGTILRAISGLVALAIGLILFAVSATFVLFALVAIAVIAVMAVVGFWIRAKVTGRPFGPRAHFEAHFGDLQAQMRDANAGFGSAGRGDDATVDAGPVLDARQTPSGWSVDR